MFIARKPFPPPASFGAADSVVPRSRGCPLLRTKQCIAGIGAINMSLLRSEELTLLPGLRGCDGTTPKFHHVVCLS
jgi:hypothetical protein